MGIIQEINLIDGLENFVDSSGTISTRKPPKLISFMRNGLDGTSVDDGNTEHNVPIFKIPKDDYAFVNIKFQAYNNNSFESGVDGNINNWFKSVLGEESLTKGSSKYHHASSYHITSIPQGQTPGTGGIAYANPIDTSVTFASTFVGEEAIFYIKSMYPGTYFKCLVELI